MSLADRCLEIFPKAETEYPSADSRSRSTRPIQGKAEIDNPKRALLQQMSHFG
jgi:hypothetical protein